MRGEPIESLGGDAESQLASLLEALQDYAAPQRPLEHKAPPEERAALVSELLTAAVAVCEPHLAAMDRREQTAAAEMEAAAAASAADALAAAEAKAAEAARAAAASEAAEGDAAAEGEADGGGDAAAEAEAAAAAAAAADEAATAATTVAAEAAAAAATAEGALPVGIHVAVLKAAYQAEGWRPERLLPSAKQRTDRLVASLEARAAAALAEAAARGGTGALTASRLRHRRRPLGCRRR